MAKAKKIVKPEPAKELEGVAKDLKIEIKEVEPALEPETMEAVEPDAESEVKEVEAVKEPEPAKEAAIQTLFIEGVKVVGQEPDGENVIVRTAKGCTYKLGPVEYQNLLDGRK